MSDTPQYTHDCDSCHFLGRYNHSDTHSDLYFCIERSMYGGTLITRYSSDPPNYGTCQPNFPLLGKVEEGKEILPHESEALKRTIQRGLYTPTIITPNTPIGIDTPTTPNTPITPETEDFGT